MSPLLSPLSYGPEGDVMLGVGALTVGCKSAASGTETALHPKAGRAQGVSPR